MRLDARQREAILEEVERVFGREALVRVFGSRLRGEARGGDVDLFVEAQAPIDDPAWRTAQLEARLMRRLDGRRVDVLLAADNLLEQPIHGIARAEGVLL